VIKQQEREGGGGNGAEGKGETGAARTQSVQHPPGAMAGGRSKWLRLCVDAGQNTAAQSLRRRGEPTRQIRPLGPLAAWLGRIGHRNSYAPKARLDQSPARLIRIAPAAELHDERSGRSSAGTDSKGRADKALPNSNQAEVKHVRSTE
jgi:hypothetical protein